MAPAFVLVVSLFLVDQVRLLIYNLHLAEFSFLFFLVAQINSKGVVAGVLDNKLAPGLSFILTGQLDHMSGKSTFGMGFLIGQ